MRASSAAAATLRTLIAAIPDDRLRDLFIGLVLNSLTSPPLRTAQPTRGRPPKAAPPPAIRQDAAQAQDALKRKLEKARRYAVKKRAAARAAKTTRHQQRPQRRGRRYHTTGVLAACRETRATSPMVRRDA
jgi:hypothetical protein